MTLLHTFIFIRKFFPNIFLITLPENRKLQESGNKRPPNSTVWEGPLPVARRLFVWWQGLLLNRGNRLYGNGSHGEDHGAGGFWKARPVLPTAFLGAFSCFTLEGTGHFRPSLPGCKIRFIHSWCGGRLPVLCVSPASLTGERRMLGSVIWLSGKL